MGRGLVLRQETCIYLQRRLYLCVCVYIIYVYIHVHTHIYSEVGLCARAECLQPYGIENMTCMHGAQGQETYIYLYLSICVCACVYTHTYSLQPCGIERESRVETYEMHIRGAGPRNVYLYLHLSVCICLYNIYT